MYKTKKAKKQINLKQVKKSKITLFAQKRVKLAGFIQKNYWIRQKANKSQTSQKNGFIQKKLLDKTKSK